MSAHTPGPWVARDGDGGVGEVAVVEALAPNGQGAHGDVEREICHCFLVPEAKGRREDLANLRLIAAAPDLLAALDPITLEHLATQVESGHRPEQVAADLRTWAATQRAAIAKARGK